MNDDYVAEILRATGSLRSGDPAGVSAIIQNTLAAAGLTGTAGAGPSGNPKPRHPRRLTPLTRRAYHGAEHIPLRTDRMRKPLSEVVRTLRTGGKGLGLEGMMPGLGQACRALRNCPCPTAPSSSTCAIPAQRARAATGSMCRAWPTKACRD